MRTFIYFIACILLQSTTIILSQNDIKLKLRDKSIYLKTESTNDDKVRIINNSGNPILIFTDEGDNAGSITLPSLSAIGDFNDKLYNLNGNLYWKNLQLGSGLSLPYSESNVSDNDAFSILNNGSGRCGYFRIDNPANNLWALDAWTNGTGDAFKAQSEGTRDAGRFEINNAQNTGNAITCWTNGLGTAGFFQVQNQSNNNSALNVYSDGMGSAARIILDGNGTNNSPSLYVSTQGQGPVIQAKSYGSGPAILAEGLITMESFRLGNSATAGQVLTADENGFGYWQNSSISFPLTSTTNSHPDYTMTLTNIGGAGAGKFVINVTDPYTNGEHSVNASTNGVGSAIMGENLGLGDAATFYINNPSNERYAIGGWTNGLGSVAYFQNQNSENINPTLEILSNGLGSVAKFTLDGNGDNNQPAVYVSTQGQGPAIQAKPWGSGPAILAEGLVDMDAIRVGLDAPSGMVLTSSGEGYGNWQKSKLSKSNVPSNSSDSIGEVGDTSWDDNYFYIKTENGWKRVQFDSW